MQFLLDEHISPRVCSILRGRRPEISIESLLEWRDGSLRGKADDAVLAASAQAGYTLVTYDLRTIPALLREWAENGRGHGGVIFIDERTCQPQDFAEIADSLLRIWEGKRTFEWKDRVAFAPRPHDPNR